VVGEKQRLRRELLVMRRAIPSDDLDQRSAAVVRALTSLPELERARTVLLYVAQPDEIDVMALFDAAPDGSPRVAGRRVALPRVVGAQLEIVTYDPARPLVPGAFGVLEPPDGAVMVPAAEVDVAVVPGVAFTSDGERLGRGGGFYDRLLPTLRPDCLVVGVCVEQAVLAALPAQAHDHPVDVVVTDASLRRRAAPSGPTPA
jgi:5-formyltetrahydrofolate cyclo-ligase